jgi:NET1-associated nuclear protein 1 (U3 small nucleolar RNA-associated protein 17)
VSWILRSSFSYRDQVPKQAIWSIDGSILAVCQGIFITLWAVDTNSVYETLVCSEVPRFHRMAFVGPQGRHLCAGGSNALVVFDVISTKGMFYLHILYLIKTKISNAVVYTFKSQQKIIGPFSRPGDENFFIKQDIHNSSKTSEYPPTTSSVFSVFTVAMNHPIQQRSLPFSIRQCIPWNYRSSGVDEHPELIAITSTGELVHIGDSTTRTREEGDMAQALQSEQNTALQPSLFQDIFGESAILKQSSTSYIDDHEVGTSRSVTLAPNGFDWDLLDMPSHLLPPMSVLFRPLAESMLQHEQHGKFVQAQSTAADLVSMDEDVEMVSQDSVIRNSVPSTGREVTEEEIQYFTRLFQDPIFTGEPHCQLRRMATADILLSPSSYHYRAI